MKQQEVCTKITDDNTNVTWHVMAYYPLTVPEAMQKIEAYMASLHNSHQSAPKPFSVVTIPID
jgi:hypothetical protein